MPEKNSICFEMFLDQTTVKGLAVPVFSRANPFQRTSSDALVAQFLVIIFTTATWHVFLGGHKYATASLHRN